MDFKKILAIALVLAALCLCVSAVSAFDLGSLSGPSEPVYIGEITKDTVKISHTLGDPDETYKFTIEVDISDLSDSDRKALEDAIGKDNTEFVINSTSDVGKVTFTDFNGLDDVYIDGDTLYIKNSQTFPYANDSEDSYSITAISFNTTSGQLFYAEK